MYCCVLAWLLCICQLLTVGFSANKNLKPFRSTVHELKTNPSIKELMPVKNFEEFFPTKCESCIVFAREFQNLVARLPSKQPRDEAEGWLVDELEKVCSRMLNYRLHRDREGVERFAKEPPRMAKFAEELVSKGVELRLDIPTMFLNQPTVESDLLRRHCESFIEDFEEEIERWFFERRNFSLERYLCGGNFAKRVDPSCQKQVKISSVAGIKDGTDAVKSYTASGGKISGVKPNNEL